jgi:hypothetical protein
MKRSRSFQGAGVTLPAVTYTDVQAGFAGSGNLGQDPLFVCPGRWVNPSDPNLAADANDAQAIWVDGDYHLQSRSPCIDAGDPNYVPPKAQKDLDGDPRVVNQHVDMGSDEYVPIAVHYNLKACYGGQCFSLFQDYSASDPGRTYVGHNTVYFLIDFKGRLSAKVTAASAAGGAWTGWLAPEVVGPGFCESEFWVRGEGVNTGLLSGDAEDVVLATVKIGMVLEP